MAVRLFCTAFVLLAYGCPGSINRDDFPSGPLPNCVGSIDVPNLFATRCGTDSCHQGDEPAAELNLIDVDPFTQLANVPSTSCEGRLRVDMSDPQASFLIDKLLGPSAIPPGCGDPMPFLSRLNGNEIACVERWFREQIEGGDAGPGVDSGPGEDAGPGEDTGPGVDAGPVDAGTDAGTDAGPPMIDCMPIDDNAGSMTCTAMFGGACEAVYGGGGTSCDTICGLASLVCTAAYADADDGSCGVDMAMPLDCANAGGRMSDYCVCGAE